MIRDLGVVTPGSTIVVPFHTFSSDDPSASMTITGLAVTDIEIYKNGGTTQRSSDSGYTLLDTDGIDFDGTTGIHGASIDLSDNSDAGFYVSGAQYTVVIASITLDTATINFIPVTFRIGYPTAILNTTIATLASQTSFTLTAGPAEDDALNNMWIIIHDIASAVQMGYAVISDYTGATKTVTLAAGTTFTAAQGDNIAIMGPMPLQPTVAGRTADVQSTGEMDSNLTMMGGEAQSATDLKDFADAGYDPATNKVEGVKTVDTTTENTDMRGTDGANTTTPPTVAEIQAELEEDGASLLDTIRDIVSSGTYGNSALKTLIDAVPTASEIQAEMEENGASVLDTIRDAVENGTYGLSALQTLIDALPTAAQIQTELEENGSSVLDSVRDYLENVTYGLSALKTLIDAIPTASEIQAELEEDGASLLDTIRDIVSSGTYGNSALKTLIDAIPTAAQNRAEMDSNSTQLAAILSKMLKYFQLALRSDSAIETDNATELTAINADGGSGAGDFSAQTDSGEALQALIAALNNISIADIFTGTEVDNDGTSINLTGAIKLLLSVLTGESFGGGTDTVGFRDLQDTKNRISATVDTDGNRTAVGTRDAT